MVVKIHPKYTDYASDIHGDIWSRKVSSRNPEGEWKKLKPNKLKNGYLRFKIFDNGKRVRRPHVHQFVWECFNIEKPEDLPVYSVKTGNGLTIDHGNGVKTDNRPCNLELMTHSENVHRNINKRKNHENMGNNEHKYIYLNKRANKYQLLIRIDGKQKHFGYFKTIEEALKRREEICKQHNISI